MKFFAALVFFVTICLATRTALACCAALALAATAAQAQGQISIHPKNLWPANLEPANVEPATRGPLSAMSPVPFGPSPTRFEPSPFPLDPPLAAKAVPIPPDPPPAVKTVLGRSERGGDVLAHYVRFTKLAISGDQVEIRGTCPSACTLVIGRVPKERICFADGSLLALHQARAGYTGPASLKSTQWMIESYPADIRTWIEAKGGAEKMPYSQWWILTAADLWAMGSRRCAD